MIDFKAEFERIENIYSDEIKAAYKRVTELNNIVRDQQREYAVKNGYTNAIIEIIKNGGTVFLRSYSADEYLVVNNKILSSADEHLLKDFSTARDLNFIEADNKEDTFSTRYRLTNTD